MKFLTAVCSYISSVLGLYSTLIFVRLVASWILQIQRRRRWNSQYGGYGYNQRQPDKPSFLETVESALGKICDPFLDLFRTRILKTQRLDFSPLLAFISINILRSLLTYFAQTGTITLWLILAVVINGLWDSLLAFLWVIMLILLLVRFFVGLSNSMSATGFINAIDPVLNVPVGLVYRLFFRKNGRMDDQKLVLVSFFIYLAGYCAARILVNWVVNLLLAL